MADFGARSDDGVDRAMGRVHDSLVGGFEGYRGWVEYVIFCLLLYSTMRMETDHEFFGCAAPKWYSQYRFYLSILVGTCIIATLGSTSFYGPVAGHGLLTHDLELIRAQRKHVVPEVEGRIAGDVEAVPTGEEGDNYVQIRKRAAPESEEGEKKEGEE